MIRLTDSTLGFARRLSRSAVLRLANPVRAEAPPDYPIDGQVDDEHDESEEHLKLPGEFCRIDDGHDVLLDEAARVIV